VFEKKMLRKVWEEKKILLFAELTFGSVFHFFPSMTKRNARPFLSWYMDDQSVEFFFRDWCEYLIEDRNL